MKVTEFEHKEDGVHIKAKLTYDELIKIKEFKFDKSGIDIEIIISEQEFQQIIDEGKKWLLSEVKKGVKKVFGLK